MLMCRLQATKTQNTGSSFAACCPLGPPPATAAGFIPQSYLGAFVGSLLLYGLTQKIKFCKFIPFSIPICFIVNCKHLGRAAWGPWDHWVSAAARVWGREEQPQNVAGASFDPIDDSKP